MLDPIAQHEVSGDGYESIPAEFKHGNLMLNINAPSLGQMVPNEPTRGSLVSQCNGLSNTEENGVALFKAAQIHDEDIPILIAPR